MNFEYLNLYALPYSDSTPDEDWVLGRNTVTYCMIRKPDFRSLVFSSKKQKRTKWVEWALKLQFVLWESNKPIYSCGISHFLGLICLYYVYTL